MQITDQQPDGPRWAIRRRVMSGPLVALCILLVFAFIAAGCAKSRNTDAANSPDVRDAALRQIAADYARTGDLPQAQAALDKLALANPAQLIVSLAEADAGAGRPAGEVAPLARLAEALGTGSPKLVAYLAPTPAPSLTAAPPTAAPTSEPPSPTPAPSLTPTALPPSPTLVPATATATAAPQKPRVVAGAVVNLRSGPGRAYPIMGKLPAAQEVEITARNASGDWWRLTWPGKVQAWVAGTVVQVLGPIDTVAVATDIPALPPTSTPAPQPTAPPVAANPQPANTAFDYRIIEQRMLNIHENGECLGNHNVFIQVVDINGAPINGVMVQRVTNGEMAPETGAKDCRWHIGVTGEGCTVFDIYHHGDHVRVVSDPTKGPVTSEVSRQLTTQDTDLTLEELQAAGYCSDRADCEWRINPGPNMPPQFCNGHYSWQVKFQRAW